MIKLNNFSKCYGTFKAVNNINLEIATGQITGFVGKNGAGKSTTIRCILNLIHPTEGNITINGLDSIKDTSEILKFVSYVPSEPIYYNGLNSNDLFKFTSKINGKSFDVYQKLANYFELDLNKKINSLSLGNRKKVALIQALIKNSKLLILDEPTSGLDPMMQEKFFKLILDYKAQGNTVFLSSHNLSEVEKYCDSTIIINDGVIVDTIDIDEYKLNKQQILTYTTKDGKHVEEVIVKNINDVVKDLSKLDLSHLEIKDKSITDDLIGYYKGANNE